MATHHELVTQEMRVICRTLDAPGLRPVTGRVRADQVPLDRTSARASSLPFTSTYSPTATQEPAAGHCTQFTSMIGPDTFSVCPVSRAGLSPVSGAARSDHVPAERVATSASWWLSVPE